MNSTSRSQEGGQSSYRGGGGGFRSASSGPRKFVRTRIGSRSKTHPRPSSGGGRSGGRGFKKSRIDERLFVNKATVVTQAKEYVPTHTFADFGVHEMLAMNLIQKGFIKPSPIQDQAIPVALKGLDVIGIAGTGTGKTAAFLVPLINKLVTDRTHKVMILAPTRELALQIETEFRAFTRGMKLFSVGCVGGAPIGKQINELARGVHVVIGTPGRVKDLIDRKKIRPEAFGSVVLDEADRMLDMGFVDDMRYILGLIPKSRQGFFFSATFSPQIKALCFDFLKDPVTVSVKMRDTASSVEQDVVRVPRGENKIDLLHDILIQPNATKVLIFCEMKRSVDVLAKELQARGFKALALHGDMRNRERENAVKALALGTAHVLIATDVAARGIDIKDISHVINYDIPSTYDTYIHRIGRTGRADKTGIALTFI